MEFELTCFALILVGICLLSYALMPSWALCTQPQQNSGWKVLSCLIVFFIVGYGVFAWHLLSRPASLIDVVVSLILFSGACFVVLVTRLCRQSVEYANRLIALERHNALHDDLTGLPNRNFLRQQISDALKSAASKNIPAAVLLMDLDRFKEVNDTLGHHVGDRLLQQVAPRLQGAIRDSDTVARLGGDEFAVVLPNTASDMAVAVSKRILKMMEPPFNVEQHAFSVGLSIGICMYPEHGENRETILRHADVAMYVAKQKGIGYAMYNKNQDTYSLNRLQLSAKLEETINRGGLELYYQPIIDLQTNRFHGLEALARWPQGNDDFIPAVDFIPMAERTGLIRKLTVWTLTAAISQLATWRGLDLDFIMSVNLSIKDLQINGLARLVENLLKEWAVPPESLMLEITESTVMTDLKQVEEALLYLDKLGVLIAIDDFGSGYSSLSRLKKMPISVIKIDRSFIRNLSSDENDAVIVHSTIELAHNMGKKVVAEGVEHPEVLEILRTLECDFAQGFNIGLPLPAAQIPSWLQQYRNFSCGAQPEIERRTNSRMAAP